MVKVFTKYEITTSYIDPQLLSKNVIEQIVKMLGFFTHNIECSFVVLQILKYNGKYLKYISEV